MHPEAVLLCSRPGRGGVQGSLRTLTRGLRTAAHAPGHRSPLSPFQFHLCANFFQENLAPPSPFGPAITVKPAKQVVKPNSKHLRTSVGSKVPRVPGWGSRSLRQQAQVPPMPAGPAGSGSSGEAGWGSPGACPVP